MGYACKNSVCCEYVEARGTYCPTCSTVPQAPPQRTKFKSKYVHDPEKKKFYSSAGWSRVRTRQLQLVPWCEHCGKIAECVHHRIPVESKAHRLDPENLVSLCTSCHSSLEAELKELNG